MWMEAPAKVAVELQRPLPDGALRIVARGTSKDGVADEAAEPIAIPAPPQPFTLTP